jgi:phosphoribosylglycinamide formyltransferase 1
MNIGILASRSGTTAAAVIEGCRTGRIAGRVAAVISNNSGAAVLELARSAGCVTCHLSRATHPEPEELDRAVAAAFLEQDTDVLLLAGYLRKVGSATLAASAGRALNIHPSLLPATVVSACTASPYNKR